MSTYRLICNAKEILPAFSMIWMLRPKVIIFLLLLTLFVIFVIDDISFTIIVFILFYYYLLPFHCLFIIVTVIIIIVIIIFSTHCYYKFKLLLSCFLWFSISFCSLVAILTNL